MINSMYDCKPFIRCGPTELSCGDGTCLPLSAKCDSVTDCKDQLDEKECRVVEFPAKRQYQEMIPPVGRKIGGGIMPVKVVILIIIVKYDGNTWVKG